MNGSRNPQRHGERSSLDALNRTIEGLEARIEGLMANGRDARGRSEERLAPRAEQVRYEQPRGLAPREDPVSEIMQRQRAIDGSRERVAQRLEQRPASSDHHAAARQAQAAYGMAPARAEGSVEDIAKALVSLRQDLKKDIAEGLEREMQSLRAEIRGIRQMAEGRGNTDDVREELQRLSAGIGQLGRQSGHAEGLRVEFDELRSVLDGLAREDSVRRMEDRWSGVEQKLSAFDQTRDDELVALAYRLDELKNQIGTMSATPAIRALENKIEAVAQSVDMLGRHGEPDGGRLASAVASQFEGLDARLDEISRAIAAAGRMQQSSSVDHSTMQRLEARIADLAGQLDLIARRPAPAQDQGLSARIEALADRIEDLSHERAALRLEERIEQLSLMLEQSHHAAPAMAGGDALAAAVDGALALHDLGDRVVAQRNGAGGLVAGRLGARRKALLAASARVPPVRHQPLDAGFQPLDGAIERVERRAFAVTLRVSRSVHLRLALAAIGLPGDTFAGAARRLRPSSMGGGEKVSSLFRPAHPPRRH
jgi:localization factor PodJL